MRTREFSTPRPLVPRSPRFSPDSIDSVELSHLMRRARDKVAPEAIRVFILSLTEQPSDVLSALLLAKEAGLLRVEEHGVRSGIDLVPLFEKIHILRAAPGVMDTLDANGPYRAHLAARDSV